MPTLYNVKFSVYPESLQYPLLLLFAHFTMVISGDLMQITVFEAFLNHVYIEFHTEHSPVSHNIKQGCIRLLCYSLYNNNISQGYINIISYITTYKKPTSNPTCVYNFLCDSINKLH